MLPRPLRALALAAAAFVLPLAFAAPGCASDAVGIDSCRQIESKRCELAPQCAAFAKAQPGGQGLPVVESSSDVERCQEFYRDQCLNGIENASDPTHPPTQDQVNACITAIMAAAACAASPTLAKCPGADLMSTALVNQAPCNVVLYRPEDLAACAFVMQPADAGVDAPSDAATTIDADATADADATGG